MSDITIFHNQSCSKSRGALQILEERGVRHDVVRYLDTPPDRATIERILDAIADEPQALIRTDDAKFKALGIAESDVVTREQVIEVLVAGLMTTQLPVASAGAIFHASINRGKFHGITCPTTPSGATRRPGATYSSLSVQPAW